ncbi:MAG: anhydro-N-acetylmuramic acid kinase [Actinobacteria bacterium]|nr:anhydro-N-acetylmuramic acid kinase [Actinomycetota bacterium]
MLPTIAQKSEKLIIGLMSGTSADGIDAALVRVRGHGRQTHLELLAFRMIPFSKKVSKKIIEIASSSHVPVDELVRLNFYLGEAFAESAQSIAHDVGIPIGQIDLIGSHGQTIRHLPDLHLFLDKKISATLQIGDPSVIAKKTGVVTVGDFRPGDMAVGGQGAPLVPIFDFIIFRAERKNRILLNIGGIANITGLPKGCTIDDVIAFDTGPGNMLIDAYCKNHFSMDFDKNGDIAGSGTICDEMLRELLSDKYFRLLPPKSTGREFFGEKFLHRIEALAKKYHVNERDTLATITALTSKSIAQSLKEFIPYHIDELIVSGGGVENKTLMQGLKDEVPQSRVLLSDDFGIPADAKEAICFAVLANETISGGFGNCPGATGAEKATVLGKICL